MHECFSFLLLFPIGQYMQLPKAAAKFLWIGRWGEVGGVCQVCQTQ